MSPPPQRPMTPAELKVCRLINRRLRALGGRAQVTVLGGSAYVGADVECWRIDTWRGLPVVQCRHEWLLEFPLPPPLDASDSSSPPARASVRAVAVEIGVVMARDYPGLWGPAVR